MTITNSTRLVTYTGNGVTTEFDYTFLIPTGALVVTLYEIATGVEGDPLSDALYSVTGLDDPAGGTVTYPLVGSPLAATHKINVKRDVAATQDLNLTNQSPYFPDELEEQLDRIVMMIQQVEETLDRTVTVAVGSGTDPADLIADLLDASAAADADAAAAAASAIVAAASAAAAAVSAGSLTAVEVQTVAAAAKATPVDADLVGVVETTGPVLKKTTLANLKATMFAALGTLLTAAAGKTTPVDADNILISDSAASDATKKLTWANLKATLKAYLTDTIIIPVTGETTVLTTGTAKRTFRMPYAFTVTAVRASLTTVSSSGIPTVDINEEGVSILSTKLTIDANEKTSTTAATAAVISDASLANDAEITIDIDVAGTSAAGLKVYLIGYRT